MPIRAIAYHPGVATAKLRRYFLAGTADEISVGEGIRRPKMQSCLCVIFTIRNDLGNKTYRTRLKALIVGNCNHGEHKDEYLIDDAR